MSNRNWEDFENRLQGFIGKDSVVNSKEGRAASIDPADPSRPVCDFCSDIPGHHVYRARDVHVFATDDADAVSKGDWGACDKCKVLIDANDRNALLMRSLKKLMIKHPQLDREYTRKALKIIHTKFFDSRIK